MFLSNVPLVEIEPDHQCLPRPGSPVSINQILLSPYLHIYYILYCNGYPELMHSYCIFWEYLHRCCKEKPKLLPLSIFTSRNRINKNHDSEKNIRLRHRAYGYA